MVIVCDKSMPAPAGICSKYQEFFSNKMPAESERSVTFIFSIGWLLLQFLAAIIQRALLPACSLSLDSPDSACILFSVSISLG